MFNVLVNPGRDSTTLILSELLATNIKSYTITIIISFTMRAGCTVGANMALVHSSNQPPQQYLTQVRTRHLQIHSVFHTCFPVPLYGRAGGLFRDFPFFTVCVLPRGHVELNHNTARRSETDEKTWESVTGNGGELGCALSAGGKLSAI